jgi:hypothetical protein
LAVAAAAAAEGWARMLAECLRLSSPIRGGGGSSDDAAMALGRLRAEAAAAADTVLRGGVWAGGERCFFELLRRIDWLGGGGGGGGGVAETGRVRVALGPAAAAVGGACKDEDGLEIEREEREGGEFEAYEEEEEEERYDDFEGEEEDDEEEEQARPEPGRRRVAAPAGGGDNDSDVEEEVYSDV